MRQDETDMGSTEGGRREGEFGGHLLRLIEYCEYHIKKILNLVEK